MTLIKFEPLKEFETISDRLQRMFSDFSHDYSYQFNPKIDISEDDKSIFIDVEVPGMKKEDMKVSLEDNILTISGEKKDETKEKNNKSFYRVERSYGSFQRSFTLPAEVNSEKTEAKYEDGILRISFEKSQPKQINERAIQIK